jgi:hypothetical protein
MSAARLPPGEGGIDIVVVLSHTPAGIPVAIEVPMERLAREKGAEAVARRAVVNFWPGDCRRRVSLASSLCLANAPAVS